MSTHEWNAAEYHRLSDPQLAWGLAVLERLELAGDETVLDAGCGSGRVTARLLERLPRGRVVALDASENMIAAARATLEPRFAGRVRYVRANLLEATLDEPVDVVFSTATFHWIPDHPRLFATLARLLRPGGRLHAQCGGGTNLARIHARVSELMRRPRFAPAFTGWAHPWTFAGPGETIARLVAAGFSDARAWLEPTPITLPDRATYRAFLESVVCRAYLLRLEGSAACAEFLDALAEAGALDAPPWSLDYVRLNLTARRPG